MENITNKVEKFLAENTDKAYKAWEIAENIWAEKEEVSKALKELKKEEKIEGRCAYKLVK